MCVFVYIIGGQRTAFHRALGVGRLFSIRKTSLIAAAVHEQEHFLAVGVVVVP